MKKRLNRLYRKAKTTLLPLKNRAGKFRRQAQIFINKNPLSSFFALLGIILLLIIVGNLLRKPPAPTEETTAAPKKVQVYSIGKAPKISVQAKIEKSGVIKLTALSGGVVQKIYHREGEAVSRGTTLFWLSNNYQGGTTATVTRQIAQKNYDFLNSTFDTQKEVVAKNREIAEKAQTQAEELREIGRQSVEETGNLISLNDEVLQMLDAQIQALETTNTLGATNAALLQLKTGKANALAGINQARAALRSSQYQTDENQEPAELTRLQRDVTLKQLEIQEKSLQLNKEIALLNLRLSQIQEATMFPASPVNGTIERVFVQEGQNVTPGTLLAQITSNKTSASAVAFVSKAISEKVSPFETSYLSFNGSGLNLYPAYISTEPTDNSLHSILFVLPDDFGDKLSNGQIITVNLPIGQADTYSAIPFIPLDSIYQTESEAYIYVVNDEAGIKKVASRKIELGQVYGEFVEVKGGLQEEDQVIVNRNLIEGELVEIEM